METVTLRVAPSTLITISKEWTDLAPPGAGEVGGTRRRLEFAGLLLLTDLVEQLDRIPKEGVDK